MPTATRLDVHTTPSPRTCLIVVDHQIWCLSSRPLQEQPLGFMRDNDGTGTNRSPRIINGSRLVTNTTTSGHDLMISSTTSAAAASRCSQLSTTINFGVSRRRDQVTHHVTFRRRHDAHTATERERHRLFDVHRRQLHHPAAVAERLRPFRAASIDRRVLPVPPTPINVTKRCSLSSPTIDLTSSTRPTNDDNSIGRFPTKTCIVRKLGESPFPNLEDPLQPVETLQPVLTQIDQNPITHQTRCRRRHQHLPAMASVHHPRRQVQGRTEVITIPRLGLTGMDPHPHRQFETTLRFDSRSHRRRR